MIKLKSFGQEVKENASHGKDCFFWAEDNWEKLGFQFAKVGVVVLICLGILIMIMLLELLHSYVPIPGGLTTPLHHSCDPRHRITKLTLTSRRRPVVSEFL